MVRSLPRKLSVLVKGEVDLNAFNLPANTPSKKADPGWQECDVKDSINGVIWIIFPSDGSREFGLSLPQAWKEYEEYTIDFEAGGEDGFSERDEFEQYLRSYVSP